MGNCAKGNRAVTYARTSGRSQDEKLSHAGQDTLMGQYCNGKGLHVIRPFYDVGSGLDTDGRPGFLEMIMFAMDPENDIGHVVIPDLSRFSRGKADPYTYLQMLDGRDIIIHSAHDSTNSDDDNDLFWDVTFIFNNRYSKEISRLTIRGQTESVKMGNDICPVVAYGFEKYYVEDGGRQRPRWRPHPVHAGHIRTMFEMRAANHLPMMICNHFNEMKGESRLPKASYGQPALSSGCSGTPSILDTRTSVLNPPPSSQENEGNAS